MLDVVFVSLVMVYFIGTPTLYLLCATMSPIPSNNIQHQALIIDNVKC